MEWGDPEFLLDFFPAGEEGAKGGAGGGGSYPGCWIPSNQIGSALLSGEESVSKMFLSARPGIALKKLAGSLTFGDAPADWDCERILERERSVVDELKVWLIQPEMRVGRSESLEELGEE